MTNPNLTAPSSESLKRQYDVRYAGDYMDADAFSTWAHEGLAGYRVRQTLAQVQNRPGRILDYGCGQGKWTQLLHEMFPEAEIAGIDISEVAVNKATQKFPKHQFQFFDGERAPFEDGSFDLVFSFHVLEHVLDVAASVKDIARLVRPGGSACIIFPCGNKHSFEDRLVSLMQDGRKISATGESVFFFEVADGHVRRMPSEKTIDLFARQGLKIQTEFYSGQFFSAFDWLVRGTGPAYIKQFFGSCEPINTWAAIKLAILRRFMLALNRFLRNKDLDLSKQRATLKQAAVLLTQKTADLVDRSILKLARWEWDRRRHTQNGSAQYLVFRRGAL